MAAVCRGLQASSTAPTPAQPDYGCPLTHTGDTRAFTISNESRQRCVQLFAELGKKIDRIAVYLRIQQRKASIAAEEAPRPQQRRRSAEQRVDDVKQMLTYFMRCRGMKRLEGELNTIRLQTNSQPSLEIDDWMLPQEF